MGHSVGIDPAHNARIDVHDLEHGRMGRVAGTAFTPNDLRNRTGPFVGHYDFWILLHHDELSWCDAQGSGEGWLSLLERRLQLHSLQS